MKTWSLVLAALVTAACGDSLSESQTPATVSSARANANAPVDSGAEETVQSTDIVVGQGAEAKSGDRISVHYTGTLNDGTVFDSSVKRGTPLDFELGAGRVIKGWDQGVVGMKVGGKRTLVIPPSLAYGPQKKGSIPPNSTLTFEVELLDVKSGVSAGPSTPSHISARHVLIQWIGCDRAPSSVVRTREQAKRVADDVLARAKRGEDIARLAVEFSDEPGASSRGGSLGRFGHGQMVGAFEEAAFHLKPGEVSGIVETPFGFHIIQRTE